MTKTIDITPTPAGYRRTLRLIIANTTNKADRAWAKKELKRVAGVTKWGIQKKK